MPPQIKPALFESLRLVGRLIWLRWALVAVCAAAAGIWVLHAAGGPRPSTAGDPALADSHDVAPDSDGISPGSAAAGASTRSASTTTPDGSSANALPGSAAATGARASSPAACGSPDRALIGAQHGGTASAPQAAAVDVVVGRNDTLERIFRKLNLSLADLATLRGMANIRSFLDRLRTGEPLHLTHRDTELQGLERRINENQTLQVARCAGVLRATVLQNPLDAKSRTIRGVIEHSLFEAVTAAGAHDQTALNLADIFGWDIDFVLDIQAGDSFAVSYQELYQNGAYVKDGPVLAAAFVNHGRRYQAVRYVDPQGNAHYFTPDGRSMHKAFLRAPVEFTRVSSRFNSARMHPILSLIRAHKGIDYAAPTGTPVRAAGDGRIQFAGPKGGYGNVVEIEHSRSIVTVYGHLSRFAKGTHVGGHVAQGAVIAYVGMTGLATGPHLHYEYRVNGVFKNPQTVPLPDAAPIDSRWRDDFRARSAPLLATLDPAAGPNLVAR